MGNSGCGLAAPGDRGGEHRQREQRDGDGSEQRAAGAPLEIEQAAGQAQQQGAMQRRQRQVEEGAEQQLDARHRRQDHRRVAHDHAHEEA
jgi:hypothetical protein